MYLFGPHTLKHANEFFGPQISDIAEAGGQPRLGQEPGQLLLWGTTVYFNGLTLDWGRDEAGFAHWLHRVLAGGMRDLFPDWHRLPHQVVELGPDVFSRAARQRP